jgi:hypothetical protein
LLKKTLGGTILLFLSSRPSSGLGQLQNRMDGKIMASEKDFTLLCFLIFNYIFFFNSILNKIQMIDTIKKFHPSAVKIKYLLISLHS